MKSRLSNQPETAYPLSPALIIVVANFFAVVITVLLLIYTANSFEKSRAEVVAVAEQHFTELILINRLGSQAGLGGLRHHFGNYVITGEDKYYDAAKQRFLAVQDTSRMLRQTFKSSEQLAALEIIDNAARHYQERLDSIAQTRKAGRSQAGRTEWLALHDDKTSIVALEELVADSVVALRGTKEQAAAVSNFYLQRLLIGYAIIGLLVGFLVLSALNYLKLIQRQNRENRELALAERRVNELMDASPEPLMVVDSQGVIQRANRIASASFGYEDGELSGMVVEELIPSGLRDKHVESRSDFVVSGESRREIAVGRGLQARRRDGSVFFASVTISRLESGSAAVFILSISDLSERNLWIDALLHSHRSQALAALCGGLAHEFNNQLQIIEGCTDLIGDNMADKRDLAGKIERATRQAATLTSQLLSFSKQQVLRPQAVDISDILASVATLTRSKATRQIDISVETGPPLPPIFVDPDQLRSALLALTSNSESAMPEGGKLRLSAKVGSGSAVDGLEPGGEYIVIEICDSGVGIPEDVLDFVTNPFFSTGDVGRGAGLGLSMADGFARQSGGKLSISSKVGDGTTVSILLPTVPAKLPGDLPDAQAEANHRTSVTFTPRSEDRPTDQRSSGKKCVLIVEDVPAVLELAVKVLERSGYEVVTATTTDGALAVLGGAKDIDLIFSDVMLPGGKTGIDLVKQVQKTDPSIPVLLTSGFAPELLEDFDTLKGVGGLLQKPYRPRELIARIEQLMTTAVSEK